MKRILLVTSLAVIAPFLLALSWLNKKPIPEDHPFHYFCSEKGREMRFRSLYEKDSDPVTQKVHSIKRDGENFKVRMLIVNPAYGKTPGLVSDYIYEITPYQVQLTGGKMTLKDLKDPKDDYSFDVKNTYLSLVMPEKGKKSSWSIKSKVTNNVNAAYFGRTKASGVLYEDCLVVQTTDYDEKRGKSVSRDYYQRGLGLVKRVNLRPNGSEDPTKGLELIP